ncbi:MAG: hypothetical protein Ct9H300mP11_15640 [Chloroflexota bacterium]|nr:MAG: hypothetical protein Ct9H300mP11_15640 [Chloroflexota bacterium]
MLESHGFLEIGHELHEMSLKGQWAEMAELVSDEMLDAFSVSGEYDEIADRFVIVTGDCWTKLASHLFAKSSPKKLR